MTEIITWDYRYKTTLRLYFKNKIYDDGDLEETEESEHIIDGINDIINQHFHKFKIDIDWRDAYEIEIHHVSGDPDIDDPEPLINKLTTKIKTDITLCAMSVQLKYTIKSLKTFINNNSEKNTKLIFIKNSLLYVDEMLDDISHR
jgi:hypothetical protein